MTEDLDSISEEERSLFRPFTRESLLAIEARIADEQAKQRELEKKRAEGEVSWAEFCPPGFSPVFLLVHPIILKDPKVFCVFLPNLRNFPSLFLSLSLVYIYRKLMVQNKTEP